MVWLIATWLAGCGGASAPSPPLGGDPPLELRCDVKPIIGCFVRVDGATFRMGAQSTDPGGPNHDADARPEEGPVREVTIAPFWLQNTEVPWWDWSRCVAEGACEASVPGVPPPARGVGALSETLSGVTWRQARAMCAFLGGRLPTEAEWEYAARGRDGRRFPWGDEVPCGLGVPHHLHAAMPPSAWTTLPGCASGAAHDPRAPSPSGVGDLAWGHWEWVEDAFDAAGYGRDAAPASDAEVPRVQRGGSWAAADWREHRAAARGAMLAGQSALDVGVRCAW